TDFDLRRWLRCPQHLHGAVLRPVPAAAVNLPDRARLPAKKQAHLRSYSRRIGRPSLHGHPQSGPPLNIAVKLCGRTVLRYHQIHPPVAVEVGQGTPALFSLNDNAALLARHGSESPFAITAQPQAAAGVLPCPIRSYLIEILAQENVLVTITIDI